MIIQRLMKLCDALRWRLLLSYFKRFPRDLERLVTYVRWANAMAPGLRNVYIETGRERPLEYPMFLERVPPDDNTQ